MTILVHQSKNALVGFSHYLGPSSVNLFFYILILFSRTAWPKWTKLGWSSSSSMPGDLVPHPKWPQLLLIGWQIENLWKSYSSEQWDGTTHNLVQLVLGWFPFKFVSCPSSKKVASVDYATFGFRTSVVITADCMGSYKSNYHTITTTTAPMC